MGFNVDVLTKCSDGFNLQLTATVRPDGIAEARRAGGNAGELEAGTSVTEGPP